MSEINNFVIEDGVLLKYKGYMPEVTIPNGVIKIGKKAFKSSSVKKVIFSDDIVEIGESAFESCHYLEEVQLSSNLQTIKKYAFFISGLKSIEIPYSVKIIEDHALSSSSLKNVVLLCDDAKIHDCAFDWGAKFSGSKKLKERLSEEIYGFKIHNKRWKIIDATPVENAPKTKETNSATKTTIEKTIVEDKSTSANIITTGNKKLDEYYGFDGELEEVIVDSTFKILVPKSFAYSTDPSMIQDFFDECIIAKYDEGNTIFYDNDTGTIHLTARKSNSIDDMDEYNFKLRDDVDFFFMFHGSITRCYPPHKKITGEKNIYVEYCVQDKIPGMTIYAFVALVGDGFYNGSISITYDLIREYLPLSEKEEERLVKTWLKTIRPLVEK